MIVTHGRRLIARAVVASAVAIFTTTCAVRERPHEDVSRRIDSALTGGDTTTAVRLLRARVPDARCSPEEYIRLAQILRSRGSVLARFSAQRILEEGLRKHPDHADILVELGQTYYEQTLYGDAQRTFERILSIDPDRCEAHYYLGANAYRKWKRVQSYTAYLATAFEHLRRSADCTAKNADGLFKLAFSEYMLGETTLAGEACGTYRRLHPEAPEPLLLGLNRLRRGSVRRVLGVFPRSDGVTYRWRPYELHGRGSVSLLGR
jgi:tetratricopeptide (TPR) repeat protein